MSIDPATLYGSRERIVFDLGITESLGDLYLANLVLKLFGIGYIVDLKVRESQGKTRCGKVGENVLGYLLCFAPYVILNISYTVKDLVHRIVINGNVHSVNKLAQLISLNISEIKLMDLNVKLVYLCGSKLCHNSGNKLLGIANPFIPMGVINYVTISIGMVIVAENVSDRHILNNPVDLEYSLIDNKRHYTGYRLTSGIDPFALYAIVGITESVGNEDIFDRFLNDIVVRHIVHRKVCEINYYSLCGASKERILVPCIILKIEAHDLTKLDLIGLCRKIRDLCIRKSVHKPRNLITVTVKKIAYEISLTV